MKKLTKNYALYLMDEDHYMDALEYFATRLMAARDPYTELEKLDSRMWDYACEGEGEEEEQWLRIYSALQLALDAE